ncbi:MAG: hypothetical protein CMF51_03490 [Legionellales bacterium]|nr:hypothetical protein [Legionellales bacterium]
MDYLDALCDQYPDYLATVINEPPSVDHRFKPCCLARAIQYDNLELAKFLMSKGASVKSKYASLSDQSGSRPNHQAIEEVILNHPRLRKALLPESRQSQGFMCCGGRPKL